jgi:hypothetical protein
MGTQKELEQIVITGFLLLRLYSCTSSLLLSSSCPPPVLPPDRKEHEMTRKWGSKC